MTTNLHDMVKVYNANGRLDGEILKAFLEANDIRVILTQEGAAAAYGLNIGALGVVEVLVDFDNADKARELIQLMDEGKLEVNGDLRGEEEESEDQDIF